MGMLRFMLVSVSPCCVIHSSHSTRYDRRSFLAKSHTSCAWNFDFHSGGRPVRSLTSGVIDSHGVTGGVYKTRERIHRGILIRDY